MNDRPSIQIDIARDLDDSGAQPVLARMKAALRNQVGALHLHLGDTASISSPGFLAFLQAVRQHMDGEAGCLRLSCANPQTRSLLELYGFTDIIEDAPAEES